MRKGSSAAKVLKLPLSNESLAIRKTVTEQCINKQLANATEVVKQNVHRFFKKIPENSINKVKITPNKDGTYLFKATSSGKIPGSRAVYEKYVDSEGKKIQYLKKTFGPDGKLIHTKIK